MSDWAYIVSRTLEDKITIAENNGIYALLVSCDVLKEIVAILKEQPEIVRCKYCEYLSYPANGVPFCKHIKNFVDANWFCADGEKRPEL